MSQHKASSCPPVILWGLVNMFETGWSSWPRLSNTSNSNAKNRDKTHPLRRNSVETPNDLDFNRYSRVQAIDITPKYNRARTYSFSILQKDGHRAFIHSHPTKIKRTLTKSNVYQACYMDRFCFRPTNRRRSSKYSSAVCQLPTQELTWKAWK
jgi:hypothetical protein